MLQIKRSKREQLPDYKKKIILTRERPTLVNSHISATEILKNSFVIAILTKRYMMEKLLQLKYNTFSSMLIT